MAINMTMTVAEMATKKTPGMRKTSQTKWITIDPGHFSLETAAFSLIRED